MYKKSGKNHNLLYINNDDGFMFFYRLYEQIIGTLLFVFFFKKKLQIKGTFWWLVRFGGGGQKKTSSLIAPLRYIPDCAYFLDGKLWWRFNELNDFKSWGGGTVPQNIQFIRDLL